MNCDAVFNYGDNLAIIEMVARDHKGDLIDGASYTMQVTFVHMAKAAAIRTALELALKNDWRRILVESDSRLVVQDIWWLSKPTK